MKSLSYLNKYLVKKLESLSLWTDSVKEQLLNQRGSVQNIDSIPDEVKAVFKTTWEVKQKAVIDHAHARAPFICQSQSMNLHFNHTNRNKIMAAQIYAWKQGLKTGVYYTRTRMLATAGACASCSS